MRIRPLQSALIMILTAFLISCTPSPRYGANPGKSDKKSKHLSKTSKKDKHVMEGISSYYGAQFHGKQTANGEIFDMYAVSAAHKTIPLNSTVRVTNLENNKSLVLRINDRGPYIEGRILDCSYGAAKKLGFVQQGTVRVRIEVLEYGDGKYIMRTPSG